jgi:hypothetical protein
MELVSKSLAIWGLGDAVWMAVDPVSWGRFWGRAISYVRQGGPPARLLAAVEFGFSLYLLLRKWD